MGFNSGFSSPGVVDAESLISLPGLENTDLTIDYVEGVDTIAQRDAWPLEKRVQYMSIYVAADATVYRLFGPNLADNTTWIPVVVETPAPSRLTTAGTSKYLDIYIEDPSNGGSDETGNGTQAAPFATIKKAFEIIPTVTPRNNQPRGIRIRLGVGTFAFPPSQADNINLSTLAQQISFTGTSIAVETVTIASAATKVAGKSARYTVTTSSPYSTVLGEDGEYFIDTGSTLTSRVCVSSPSSNTIEIAGTLAPGTYTISKNGTFLEAMDNLGYGTEAHNLFGRMNFSRVVTSTTFNFGGPGNDYRLCNIPMDSSSDGLWGDKYNNRDQFVMYNCSIVSTSKIEARLHELFVDVSNCLLKNLNISVRQSRLYYVRESQLVNSNLNVGWEQNPGNANLGNNDFYDNADSCVTLAESSTLIVSSGTINTFENCSTALLLERNSFMHFRGGSTFRGATTSVPVVVRSGSRLIGLSSSNGLLTNSTNPGQEVQLGATLKLPISELPAREIKEGVSAE